MNQFTSNEIIEAQKYAEHIESEVCNKEPEYTITSIADIYYGYDEILKKRYELYKNGVPISFGIANLDEISGGIQTGIVTVLGGESSTGKTTMMCMWAKNAALSNASTLYITSEMTKEQIFDKIVASETRISFGRLRYGKVSEADYQKMHDAFLQKQLLSKKFDICHMPRMQMKTIAKIINESNYKVCFIDYLQLLEVCSGDNKVRELEEALYEFKRIASSKDIAIVLSSQFNKDKEFKWASAINEAGQLCMKLILPSEKDLKLDVWDIDLHLTKNTFGPTTIIPLELHRTESRFCERQVL